MQIHAGIYWRVLQYIPIRIDMPLARNVGFSAACNYAQVLIWVGTYVIGTLVQYRSVYHDFV